MPRLGSCPLPQSSSCLFHWVCQGEPGSSGMCRKEGLFIPQKGYGCVWSAVLPRPGHLEDLAKCRALGQQMDNSICSHSSQTCVSFQMRASQEGLDKVQPLNDLCMDQETLPGALLGAGGWLCVIWESSCPAEGNLTLWSLLSILY